MNRKIKKNDWFCLWFQGKAKIFEALTDTNENGMVDLRLRENNTVIHAAAKDVFSAITNKNIFK